MNELASGRPAPTPPAGMEHPFAAAPADGEAVAVGPGILWIRMPLPFALDHINLWLLREDRGWTAIDTGIASDEVRSLWQGVFAGPMGGDPLDRLVVTHFHPDHVGLAGWLAERTGAGLVMTLAEWLMATLLHGDSGGSLAAAQVTFYRRHGLADEWLDVLGSRGNTYRRRIAPPPMTFSRIADGDTLTLGGETWRVIVGTGHAPEHACLYNPDRHILVSGDQVLPRITPNISLLAAQPDGNPLGDYLESLGRFRELPEDTLVLPSHGHPFRGLHSRLDLLARHHEERLGEVLLACDRPRTAAEILPVLFRRELDAHQIMFAMGESLSHLAWLEHAGRLSRAPGDDGVERFFRRPD